MRARAGILPLQRLRHHHRPLTDRRSGPARPANNMRVDRFETERGRTRHRPSRLRPNAAIRFVGARRRQSYPGRPMTRRGTPVLDAVPRRARRRIGFRRSRLMARRASRHLAPPTGAADTKRPSASTREDHRLALASLRARHGAVRVVRSWAISGAIRCCARRARPPTGRCAVIHAADLARRLARDAEAVCRHYLSKGRRAAVTGSPATSSIRRPKSLCAATGPDYGPGAAGKWSDADRRNMAISST